MDSIGSNVALAGLAGGGAVLTVLGGRELTRGASHLSTRGALEREVFQHQDTESFMFEAMVDNAGRDQDRSLRASHLMDAASDKAFAAQQAAAREGATATLHGTRGAGLVIGGLAALGAGIAVARNS